MSVTFTAAGMPTSTDVDTFGGELDVNMSNTNAALVCATLGIELEPDWDGEMDAPLFLGRVVMAMALAPSDEGMPSYEHVGPGARMIEGARRPGYVQDRLLALHALAYALVWWC